MFSHKEILSKKKDFQVLKNEVPKWGHIYFLIDGNFIIYVGKSVDYISRIKVHACATYPLFHKFFTHYFSVRVPYRDMTKIERKYIKKLRPLRNIQSNN